MGENKGTAEGFKSYWKNNRIEMEDFKAFVRTLQEKEKESV